MLDASCYSLIERTKDGRFTAWVPDLPSVMTTGDTEEVIRTLSQTIRQCVREMVISGETVPKARPMDELPRESGERGIYRHLLVFG